MDSLICNIIGYLYQELKPHPKNEQGYNSVWLKVLLMKIYGRSEIISLTIKQYI